MINSQQLRELGWSEELIAEVTRQSGTIGLEGTEVDFPKVDEYHAEARHSVFIDHPEANTGTAVVFAPVKPSR